MDKRPKILIVEDDIGHLITLKTLIKSWGYGVEGVDSGKKAVELVKDTPFDLILMDVRMVEMSGIEALKHIRAYNPAIPIIIMTAYSSVESAVEALKNGAYDYLTKPLDFEALRILIERAIEHVHLKSENLALKKRFQQLEDIKIVGKSKAMKELLDQVAMIAPTDATVLITGESGTGKELIAKLIHLNSDRKEKPFVVVNCAAITETLLESELFGHEKGAFTGADKKRDGRFMRAHKGTIFLDEIGELPRSMQAKLLRVLQNGEIQRVGSDKTLKVDVRVITATNKNLEQEVKKGNFREDLYYRLNVVNLKIPPLRERKEDIPVLAQHFLNIFSEKNKKYIKGFTPKAMDMLMKYHWPGNVRELENTIERAVILLTGEYISEKELPPTMVQNYKQKDFLSLEMSKDMPLEELEKKAILTALRTTNGNKSEAAKRLRISRRTLYLKMEKYGIKL